MLKNKLLAGLGVMATTTALMAVTVPAASADETDVTFEVTGGALSITAAAAATLSSGASGSASVNGSLGETKVTDIRGGTAGWTARAATTAFDNSVPDDPDTTEVNESAAATTSTSDVSYASGPRTTTGSVLTTTSGPTDLTGTPATVVTGSAVLGNNTAAWNPTLTVSLPTTSTTGNYHGTITTSVL